MSGLPALGWESLLDLDDGDGRCIAGDLQHSRLAYCSPHAASPQLVIQCKQEFCCAVVQDSKSDRLYITLSP